MAGGQPLGPDPVGELEQRRKPEHAVAAHARVGGLALAVGAHELGHDRPPKRLAQVEREVRQAQGVAGVAGGPHRVGRAAGPLAVGSLGIDPEPQRDTDRLAAGLRHLQQGHGAVDATAHGHRHPPGLAGQRACRGGDGERLVQGINRQQQALAVAGIGLKPLLDLADPDPGRAQQLAALGQLADQRQRGGRVRAGPRAMAGRDHPAILDQQLDPHLVTAACRPRLAHGGAGAERSGPAEVERMLDNLVGVHPRRIPTPRAAAPGRDRLSCRPSLPTDHRQRRRYMSKPFKGTINIDIKDSVPDWEPYTQPIAPEDAPNVLYVVLDDVGFSAMEPYGGLIETPNIKRIAERGLTYTNFHTTALCSPDPLMSDDRPQSHDERHGLHHRGHVRIPQRERPHPVRVREPRRGARRAAAGTLTSSASGTSAPRTR